MAINCPSNILGMSGLLDFSSLTVIGIPLSLSQLCKHEYWQPETSGFSFWSSAAHFPLLLVFMVMLLSSFHLLQSFSGIFAFFFSQLLNFLFRILLSVAVTVGNPWLKSKCAFWSAKFSSGIPCMIYCSLYWQIFPGTDQWLILYSYSSKIIFIKAWKCTSAFTHGAERKQLSVSCHTFL